MRTSAAAAEAAPMERLVRLDDAYLETARSLPHVQRLIPESRPLFNRARLAGARRAQVRGPADTHADRERRRAYEDPHADPGVRQRLVRRDSGKTHGGRSLRGSHYRTRFRSICASEPALHRISPAWRRPRLNARTERRCQRCAFTATSPSTTCSPIQPRSVERRHRLGDEPRW